MSHEVFRKHTNNVHSLGFFVRADATIDLRKHEQMLFCTLYISEPLEIHEVFCRFYESSNNPAAVQFRTTKMSSDVCLNLRAQKAALEQPALLTGLQDVVWKGQPSPALNAATFLTRPSQLPCHSFCNPVAWLPPLLTRHLKDSSTFSEYSHFPHGQHYDYFLILWKESLKLSTIAQKLIYCITLVHSHKYILVRKDTNHIADGFTRKCVFDQQQLHCAVLGLIAESQAVLRWPSSDRAAFPSGLRTARWSARVFAHSPFLLSHLAFSLNSLLILFSSRYLLLIWKNATWSYSCSNWCSNWMVLWRKRCFKYYAWLLSKR